MTIIEKRLAREVGMGLLPAAAVLLSLFGFPGRIEPPVAAPAALTAPLPLRRRLGAARG